MTDSPPVNVKPCPRRRVVSSRMCWEGGVPTWTLVLDCGHRQERRYMPEGWKAPRTTQCGMCWRQS